MNILKSWFELMRAKQWVKNLFILVPLFFAGKLFVPGVFDKVILALVAFCFVSSGLYIFNDLWDRQRDSRHPKKLKRPLASGKINLRTAVVAAVVFLCLGLALSEICSSQVFMLALLYAAVNLSYNWCFKGVVIMDIIVISLGFEVRVWAGAVAVGVIPTVWLQLCVFVLALFLGFAKRRHELVLLKDKASLHRQVLSFYNIHLLDQLILLCAGLSIITYGLYSISPEVFHRLGNYQMAYSVPVVIYGIFRFFYLIHVKGLGDEPVDMLIEDKPLALSLMAWVLLVFVILYMLKG